MYIILCYYVKHFYKMITKSHFQDKEPILEGFLSWLRFNKVIKFIPQNSVVLDVGAGYNSNLLQKIKNKISSGVGVDAYVNKKDFGPKIKLVETDLNKELPFPHAHFDVVVSLANLEHLEYPKLSMAEMFRVLKPGGLLLLTTPSIYAKPVLEFLSFNLKVVNEEEIRDHKNYFNKTILTKLFNEAGFSFVKHEYFEFFMNNFVYARK